MYYTVELTCVMQLSSLAGVIIQCSRNEQVLLKHGFIMKDEYYTKPILQNINEFIVKYILDTRCNINLLNKDARTQSRV